MLSNLLLLSLRYPEFGSRLGVNDLALEEAPLSKPNSASRNGDDYTDINTFEILDDSQNKEENGEKFLHTDRNEHATEMGKRPIHTTQDKRPFNPAWFSSEKIDESIRLPSVTSYSNKKPRHVFKSLYRIKAKMEPKRITRFRLGKRLEDTDKDGLKNTNNINVRQISDENVSMLRPSPRTRFILRSGLLSNILDAIQKQRINKEMLESSYHRYLYHRYLYIS